VYQIENSGQVLRSRPSRSRLRLGRPRVSQTVLLLGFTSMVTDISSEMVSTILPMYLVLNLGLSPFAFGVIDGLYLGAAAIVRLVGGFLADRSRRPKEIAVAGYAFSALSRVGLLVVGGVWTLLASVVLIDRLGKGIRTSPRDALIADETPPAARGRAFGFHRAADSAGAVAGPLLGLVLYELLDHRIRPLFFVAFVPAAVSAGLVAFVRERPRHAPAAAAPERRPQPLPGRYWRVVGFLTLFGLVNFSDALLILRARELGLGFAGVVGAYVLYNVTYAALSYPAGVLSDRVPRRAVFAGGLAVFAVAYAGLGLATSSAWVWVLLPLYGCYTALTDGVGKAWISDLVPASATGTGLGVYYGLTGGAAVLAGVWAGMAWSGDGRLPLLVSGSAVAVLALALATSGRSLDPLPDRV